MKVKSFFLPMDDGVELYVNQWFPDGDIKAVIQFCHGMAEHGFRYEKFGMFLAENGYGLVVDDHRGHGKTAQKALQDGSGDFGWLSAEKGFARVVHDQNNITSYIRSTVPGKKIILAGHSFGSFIAQSYMENYGSSIDGCILLGTAGPEKLQAGFGKIIASGVSFFMGKRYISRFINNITFGLYNKKIGNVLTPFDWLSRDTASVKRYEEDPFCGFIPSVNFFYEMFTGLCSIHKRANIQSIPRSLPLLILYGTDDPVGSYGKTVKKLIMLYQKRGITSITTRAYVHARHELLHEINSDSVCVDILTWLDNC